MQFLPWKTVHEHIRVWRDSGVWERIVQQLREQGPKGRGTKRPPHRGDYRFAICQNGARRGRRGYDAGKKIKGRKRHIAVDTRGNLLAVIVHSAGIEDRVAARAVLIRLFCRFESITTVLADGGYTGKRIDWAEDIFGYPVEIQKRNEQHRFQLLPRHWIVERTFAWLNWSRRLGKDYELRPSSAVTMTYIAFAHLLLRRSNWFLDRFSESPPYPTLQAVRSSQHT
jgi:transposase